MGGYKFLTNCQLSLVHRCTFTGLLLQAIFNHFSFGGEGGGELVTDFGTQNPHLLESKNTNHIPWSLILVAVW